MNRNMTGARYSQFVHLRAVLCAVFFISQGTLISRSATNQPVVPESKVLVERLRGFHHTLENSRSMSEAMNYIYPVGRDLMLLSSRCHQEDIDPATLLNPGETWEYFTALWIPMEGLFLRNSLKIKETLRHWGIDLQSEERSYGSDLFTYFFLLHLLVADDEGRLKLGNENVRAYRQLLLDYHPILSKMKIYPTYQLQEKLRMAPNWIFNTTDLLTISQMAERIPWDMEGFLLISSSQFKYLRSRSGLGETFRRVIMAGPSHYREKWRCHGWMLERMKQLAVMTPRIRAVKGLAIYEPLYQLLCHSGVPISPFQPYDEASLTKLGEVYHFARPYKNERPDQGIFTEASHLATAIALSEELSKRSLSDFNPVKHMLMIPFDVVVRQDDELTLDIYPRDDGFAGYKDWFEGGEFSKLVKVEYLEEEP